MGCGSCGKPKTGEEGYTLASGCFCNPSSFSSVTEVQGGIVGALGGCVDSIRDIYTQLGARTYEVWLVWTKWAGGERGAGEEYVYRTLKLEPTPLIGDLTAVDKQPTEIGLTEVGPVKVSEISTRYEEHLLTGSYSQGGVMRPVPKDESFYWEIVSALATPPIRRRFFPASAPNKESLAFQWTIELVRAHADRTPAGLPGWE